MMQYLRGEKKEHNNEHLRIHCPTSEISITNTVETL